MTSEDCFGFAGLDIAHGQVQELNPTAIKNEYLR